MARGYLAGSGWKEYKETRRVCGIRLPEGLVEAAPLSEPIFTPATKNDKGHDENVTFDFMASAIGREEAERLRDLTLDLYNRASAYAQTRGLILADTKLEFGRRDGQIIWIDEAFTSDSSRYWDARRYTPGNWLESTGWNKRPPAPRLPEGVVRTTREKYLEAYRVLTGSMPEFVPNP